MGTHSLIAIKKSRRQAKQRKTTTKQNPNNSDDKLKIERDRRAEAYVRENFVLWQHNQYDGAFDFEGVGMFRFLRKFLDEWTEEQRREYIDNLDRIQEFPEELESELFRWNRRHSSDLEKYSTPVSRYLRDAEFLKYQPACSSCGSLIFEILDVKKGQVSTRFTEWDLPLDGVFCEYGYIVDFDENELHVLFCNPESEFSSCELLKPLEEIYEKRGLVVSTKFKLSELPRTEREFIEVVYNNAMNDNDDDS